MTFTEMKPGVPYIVTQGSRSGSFQVGDQITLLTDGSILNQQAAGWLEPEDLAEATVGMKCEVDRAKLRTKKALLLRRLAELETLE